MGGAKGIGRRKKRKAPDAALQWSSKPTAGGKRRRTVNAPPEDPAEDAVCPESGGKKKKTKKYVDQDEAKVIAYELGAKEKLGLTVPEIAAKHGVSSSTVYQILQHPNSRAGVGGRKEVIMEEEIASIVNCLRENAYRLTFTELEQKTGIPSSTIFDHFKRYPEKWKTGWNSPWHGRTWTRSLT